MLELLIEPSQYSIRLVGGSQDNEGRVQLYYNGQWSAVCNGDWDFNDARVACRQLGHADAVLSVKMPKYGNRPNKELQVLNYVHCKGNESGLQYCSSDEFGIASCNENEVAGVVCAGMFNGLYNKEVILY